MKKVKLIDLPIEWKRGNGLQKSDIEIDGDNKCILYGELFTKHKNVLIACDKLSRTNKIGSVKSKAGDILVPGTSTAVKRDMILAREIDEEGVFLGGDINIIRPQKDLFARKYAAYYFETIDAYEQLEGYINGATGIIHISNTGLKNLEIPLPPIPEQQRIVALLDEAFAAIAMAKANAEQNLKNAKELFESYLQGVFENKGEGWKEKSLKEICSIGDGNYSSKYPKASEFQKEGIPFLTPSNIKNGTVVSTDLRFISKEQHSTLTKGHVIKDDLVVVVRGFTTGNNSLLPKEYANSNLNSQLAYLRVKNSDILSEFLFRVFNSPIIKKVIQKTISGANQRQLPNNKLMDIKISYPSIKEQQAIIQKLDSVSVEIKKIESIYQQKINDLEELKKSLLQKAFSGELKKSTVELAS